MTTAPSKVTLHMVSSLDGFIARKDNDVSWIETPDTYDKGVTLTDEQITTFLEGIDCYVMGAKTYEHALALGWPYGNKPVVVLTRRPLKSARVNVTFYAGDLEKLVTERLKPTYKNIWVVGGAAIAKDFLRARLVDEIIVTVKSILLGEGLLFFDSIGVEQPLHLKDVTAYENGMVELWYEVRK
ncbi:dihydrofolate reductase family protein [uncultured Imperialibacter sp.]|uniref:dihydrofolate reductase family protein n=1 Tax=uncultured Imperialibacter sp. TaxID=1672639 RepID=UPI0030DC799B|tara:strand:+ start:55960 stop:56511 length:552 start_codon:yes stop_codon:yes gene_type:complete